MRISEEKSSLLKDLSYDAQKRTMTVTYREDNSRFAYHGISAGLYAALSRSTSPGETWSRIRKNYDYDRV